MLEGPSSKSSPLHLDITVSFLWVLTPLLATTSVAIVTVAMTTNQWLHTQENMSNPSYNGTGDNEYLPKSTVSGLWKLCTTKPGEDTVMCFNIDYFPREEYTPDPNDSTMAIPYTVTKASGFFVIATLLLLAGELCCVCGHISRQRRLLTFISGLIFIISGLFMLIGLVMYISVLKAEIGGKLRPRSQLQPPLFTFRYGYSFILYVSGFIATEVSGTCAVFLYIYWHQREWLHKKTNLRRKLSGSLYLEANMLPLCRRHPQLYISSNNMRMTPPLPCRFSPIHQRRFYLDKDPGISSDNDGSPTCQKHGKVALDDDLPPPPPEAYLYHRPPILDFPHRNVFPRDATTNTVSTAVDIETDDDYSPSISHEHDFTPFDLDQIDLEHNEKTMVPLSRQTAELRRSECSFDSVRRTTPV